MRFTRGRIAPGAGASPSTFGTRCASTFDGRSSSLSCASRRRRGCATGRRMPRLDPAQADLIVIHLTRTTKTPRHEGRDRSCGWLALLVVGYSPAVTIPVFPTIDAELLQIREPASSAEIGWDLVTASRADHGRRRREREREHAVSTTCESALQGAAAKVPERQRPTPARSHALFLGVIENAMIPR